MRKHEMSYWLCDLKSVLRILGLNFCQDCKATETGVNSSLSKSSIFSSKETPFFPHL